MAPAQCGALIEECLNNAILSARPGLTVAASVSGL